MFLLDVSREFVVLVCEYIEKNSVRRCGFSYDAGRTELVFVF